MKPDAKTIIREATRLKDERFKNRDQDLEHREMLRFRKLEPDIPAAYEKTAMPHKTSIIEEEGRALVATLAAWPMPHAPSPTPEDQPRTTLMEQWLSASHQELESHYGSAWEKCRQSQLHAKIGWIYCGLKRKPYAGQPKAPDSDDAMELADFGVRNARFKQDAGISAVFDYRHAPTNTIYSVGDVFDPLAIYEIKEVDEQELIMQYGLRRDYEGTFSLPDATTLPAGEPEYRSNSQRKIMVVEYWDRNYCAIVVQNNNSRWRGSKETQDGLIVEEWQHNWGRVPYFAAPAFVTDALAEEHRFASPLDGIYAEALTLNTLETMVNNIGYLTGYPAMQIVTKEGGEQILDDTGQPKVTLDFEPGKFLQLGAGQQALQLPWNEGPELMQQLASVRARMQQFSLSPIAKGVSPGADTANSAMTNLRRLQRSSLDPIVQNSARQIRQMYQYMLKMVQKLGEPVPVYAPESGEMVMLAPDDIVTMNIQVKVEPDSGQDQLIEEKQAFELMQMGGITEQEFHERRGKENPEEYVRANVLERLWKMIEPQMQTMILADLGNTQAIAQLIAASQQTGDASSAIPGIMAQIQERLGPTGMGSGSGGMPRTEGVRSPAVQMTTQPGPNGVYGGA